MIDLICFQTLSSTQCSILMAESSITKASSPFISNQAGLPRIVIDKANGYASDRTM